VDVTHLILLAAAGLLGGIGITALGPGGVLPTIALFLFSGLSPSGVAGTAIVTHVATGLLGTAAYARSGQLRARETRRVAAVLAAVSVVGAPLGVLLNTRVSGGGFGILLACVVAVAGILVWVRDVRSRAEPRGSTGPLTLRAAAVGGVVSVVAGLFGLGGPLLSVPLLIGCGMPVLSALAVAQVQSVVIAGVGSAAYLAHGAVDWPLAALVGIPELAGVLIGVRIARSVPTRRLKYALVGCLLVLAPYLAWRS
jgi:uncharacterized membrane protein YfcA